MGQKISRTSLTQKHLLIIHHSESFITQKPSIETTSEIKSITLVNDTPSESFITQKPSIEISNIESITLSDMFYTQLPLTWDREKYDIQRYEAEMLKSAISHMHFKRNNKVARRDDVLRLALKVLSIEKDDRILREVMYYLVQQLQNK